MPDDTENDPHKWYPAPERMMIIQNNTCYNVFAVMAGVRDYKSNGALVALSDWNGRPTALMGDAEIDILDLVAWLREHRPELLSDGR